MRESTAPDPGDTRRAGRLSPDFWKFLVGQTVSSLGSSFTVFALPLLVFKLTGSALSLAYVTAAEYLPYLLFGLIIGAGVDRVDRRRLMIFVDTVQALVIFSIPLLAMLDLLSLWWVYAVGFVSSTLWVCFNTAEFAALPSLVSKDDLVAANGRLQASYSAATVAGPLLALLMALVPVYGAGPRCLLIPGLCPVLDAHQVEFQRRRPGAAGIREPATGYWRGTGLRTGSSGTAQRSHHDGPGELRGVHRLRPARSLR